jgi:diguanylate cyclase (GGDEF)-like protein
MFRLWSAVRHGIVAKMHLLSFMAVAAVATLSYASIHFAQQTEQAAARLYGEGVVSLKQEALVEVLFEQHRRLVQASPAELDRVRLRASRAALAEVDLRLGASINDSQATDKWLKAVALELPMLQAAGMEVLRLAENFAQDKALEASQGAYEQVAGRIEELLRRLREERVAAVNSEVGYLAEAGKSLTVWVILSALLALAVIGPIRMIVEYRVLGRLGQITAAMRRLSRRDLAVEVPRTEDPDEVGDIARAVQVFKANAIDLVAAHLQLDTALNNMSHGLCLFDADLRVVLFNDRFLDIFRFPREIARPGATILDLLNYSARHGAHPGVSGDDLLQILVPQLRISEFVRFHREFVDGRIIAVTFRAMPAGGWVATYEDVTDRRNAELRIAHMAEHDGLTDLPNRLLFKRKLAEGIAHMGQGQKLALLCLDLNGFKTVNDMFGHPAGDELLRQVGQRLSRCIQAEGKAEDSAGRFGGDEFAILQTGCEQPEAATALAAQVLESLSQPFDLGGQQAVVSASIGIAISPDDGGDPDQLLMCADMAMYGAKGEGRGAYRFFEPEMDRRVKSRRRLEADLRAALNQGQFQVFYQPIVSLPDNEISGFEALLRWRHPERGMVAPAEFIPVAEETGLIVPLGGWVLRQACADAAQWPRGLRVAVNLSPLQFRSADLIQSVFQAVGSARLDPGRLELEITETVLLLDNPAILATLHRLRDCGVRIAMDDFGTGYSSLSYLRSFPFDRIKIDKGFIRELAERDDALAIVAAVTTLAASLGMDTTAEGVETSEQLASLRKLGCSEAQGYLFSVAVPAADISRLLSEFQKPFVAAA